MRKAKTVLALTLVLAVSMVVCASAQQADVKSLAGKWKGWATGTGGTSMPAEVIIAADGSYTSLIGANSGRGNIKADKGKYMAEGHLSGTPVGTGMSSLTVADKGGKKVMSGQGRNDVGPYSFELTKE